MKIIAVTSCSTGIAHTYMAAAAIEKSAKKLGHQVKVETQGSIGIENKLSSKDIKDADFVIFGADVAVIGRERFSGKIIFDCGSEIFIKNKDKAMDQAIKYYNERINER